MSKYTSIILLIPPAEEEDNRISEVNSFKLASKKSITLKSLNDLEMLPTSTYVGTYNYFDHDAFLAHLHENVKWEYPEYVQVIVKEEGARNCKIYSHAGLKLLEDSVMY